MTLSREMIAAYTDGELEGETLHEVEALLAADPSLLAQVEAHRALKARLSTHFAPIAKAPVPERLIRAIKGGAEVIDLSEAKRQRQDATTRKPRWRWIVGPALAASLVLALFGTGLVQRSPGSYAESEIAAALENQLVETQSAQASVRILLSFRDSTGHICRGFSSTERSGIACRDDRGWKLNKVIGGSRAAHGDGEYRQAGSADAAVLAAIQDIAQGPALDAQEEQSARSKDWRE
jgi:hypothetical protein